MARAVALAALLLVALPIASAQGHDHGAAAGSGAVVTRDLHPSGLAIVGSLSHFGFVLADADGQPIRHKDGLIRVMQDGVILFETMAHEYDGVYSLDYVFVKPGPFTVTLVAKIGDQEVVDVFEGVAVIPRAPFPTQFVVEKPAAPVAGRPMTWKYRVADANLTLVPHTDSIFVVERLLDRKVVVRTHVHSHLEDQALTFVLDTPGEYQVRMLGYDAFPGKNETDFLPIAVEMPLTVARPTGPAPALPAVALDAAAPAAAEVQAGGFELKMVADPDARVGSQSQIRLGAVAWDPTLKRPVQHVDFALKVVGPDGAVRFESASLHEYDGVAEVLVSYATPGEYKVEWTARAKGEEREGATTFTVLPPVVPLDFGPYEIKLVVDAPKQGVPTKIKVDVRNAAGRHLDHGESEIAILSPSSLAPILLAKLHAHSSPPEATVTFPEAGRIRVLVRTESLMPGVTFTHGDKGLGSEALFFVDVEEALATPSIPVVPAKNDPPRSIP
ncbi:MAG TPA: hypothetical protein VM889_09245, partial [Candidatus Thermoplasmatota archaeon]|nr:hypothetical protein [Candidatus Thermoplasmatota archaeon]